MGSKRFNKFLIEFMSNDVKDENGNVNFIPYIQKASEMLAEGKNATKIKCKLLIPENHMVNVDNREIKWLPDAMRQRTYAVNILKVPLKSTKPVDITY